MVILDLNRVNLLIFDECHHGVKDQPMRQVMRSFETLANPPRVLGLTATLLNGNCKPASVMREVNNLEITYQSTIATVEELQDVIGYVKTIPVKKVTPICFFPGFRLIPGNS